MPCVAEERALWCCTAPSTAGNQILTGALASRIANGNNRCATLMGCRRDSKGLLCAGVLSRDTGPGAATIPPEMQALKAKRRSPPASRFCIVFFYF